MENIASDEDFNNFIKICDSLDSSNESVIDTTELKLWKIKLQGSDFVGLRLIASYSDVEPEVVYDVLHDHYFRREWDTSMIEGSIVEQIDGFNEVGYYAAKIPFSLVTNRDFCNHRAWRVFPERNEWVIFNNSVVHNGCPERKSFVRGKSIISGYLLRRKEGGGTTVTYYSHADPKGWLPSFLVNWVMTKFAPSTVTSLHAASINYPKWKQNNRPDWKPWLVGYDVNEEPYARHDPTR